MFFKKTLKITKIILINLLIFFVTFVIFEIFLGTWFKNDFKYKLSSERNINRVYKLDFEYHKGTSHYIKNNYGFRIKNDDTNYDPSIIDIVFAGGSTINQKFINFDDSIVGILSNKNKNLKMANAGIDGMSIKGHINSFKFWFNKIKNLKPNKQRMFSLSNEGYTTATDFADYLVQNKNLSFREAYKISAKLVNYAEKKKKEIG